MGSRFRNPSKPSTLSSRETADGFGEWWAAISIVGLAAVAVLVMGGRSAPLGAATQFGEAPIAGNGSTASNRLVSLDEAEQTLSAIDRGLADLCREPVLVALELEPDCTTGAMTIGDALFNGRGSSELKPSAKEDIRAAVATFLAALKRNPVLWDALEAIEIRGHSDPRAFRNAYTTNMVGSQQRALGVLFFLAGDEGLSKKDQDTLRELASVSGVSFSRPPENCSESVRECYPQWRRVEVLPVFSEMKRRQAWAETVSSLRRMTEPKTGVETSRSGG